VSNETYRLDFWVLLLDSTKEGDEEEASSKEEVGEGLAETRRVIG